MNEKEVLLRILNNVQNHLDNTKFLVEQDNLSFELNKALETGLKTDIAALQGVLDQLMTIQSTV